MTEQNDMEAVIEAILFVSSEPVPRTKLVDLFEEDEREQAREALEAVLARYGEGVMRGVMVEEVAGGIRLVTRPEMVGWLRRFFDVAGSNKLSMAALETLAIIAYRQPVTGPEIQELRGVSPSGVIKTLLERRMVRIAGRKEVVGKPFLYGTTREFLVHFGLNSLKDLPPLEEFEESFGAAMAGDGGAAAPSQMALDAMGVGPDFGAGAAARFEGAADAEGEAGAVPAVDPEERFLREVAELEELDERRSDEEDAATEEEAP
jgi:segregation and condensation protein B